MPLFLFIKGVGCGKRKGREMGRQGAGGIGRRGVKNVEVVDYI